VSVINKLVLEDINSTYFSGEKKLPVLDNVSMHVGSGEFVSLLGPSGSGKSTILKIAAALLKPDSGKILIDGIDVTGKSRLVGYMPQRDLLFPWKTLKENAALPLLASGSDKRDAYARVEELIHVFGLEGFADYYPQQLSGGMRQRAALMRTMLVQSELLLLDEPFASLDALTRDSLQDWLLSIWEHFKHSVLFVTHSIDEAIYLSDRVYVISERPGKITVEQKIDLTRPRSKEVLTSPLFTGYKQQMISALAGKTAIDEG
jgi:putative hydroxymethylpyrimidine transport system ATP-binding protein